MGVSSSVVGLLTMPTIEEAERRTCQEVKSLVEFCQQRRYERRTDGTDVGPETIRVPVVLSASVVRRRSWQGMVGKSLVPFLVPFLVPILPYLPNPEG